MSEELASDKQANTRGAEEEEEEALKTAQLGEKVHIPDADASLARSRCCKAVQDLRLRISCRAQAGWVGEAQQTNGATGAPACIFRLLQRFPCSRNPQQVGVGGTPDQFPLAPLHMLAAQSPVPAAGGGGCAADSRFSSPEEIPSRQLDTGQIPIEL